MSICLVLNTQKCVTSTTNCISMGYGCRAAVTRVFMSLFMNTQQFMNLATVASGVHAMGPTCDVSNEQSTRMPTPLVSRANKPARIAE